MLSGVALTASSPIFIRVCTPQGAWAGSSEKYPKTLHIGLIYQDNPIFSSSEEATDD